MICVLTARIAKLRHLETARGRLLVLRRRVVTILTGRALQCNNFAHLFYFLSSLASHLGWQAACLGSLLTRRDAGLGAPAALFLKLCCWDQSGQAHALPHPLSMKSPEFERAGQIRPAQILLSSDHAPLCTRKLESLPDTP